MSIFDENTEHEDRPEFDDNGEPIIYIEEDIIPDEFASEDDGVIDLDVQDDSFYETVWGGDASSVATLAADDSTTGEEVTDPLEVEVEQDTKDTTENDGILEQANEDYNNAVDILIDILTQALAQGEITEEMNASILDAQGTKTKNEQIIKEICNVQEDNSILKQLADIKANMVAASVDDILDILTQGGTKPWLYKDSDNNVLVDGQSIPELTVLVNKLNLIATGGDEASEIQLTPEFINLISTSDIKLQAKNITLEGLVTANDNFKILEDGSIVAKNGTFTGKVFIGNNGSVIDDSALSDGIQQGAKDGTLAVQKLEIVNADIKNLKADKADIKDLNATNAKIENLTANKADIEYLTANYATIKQLNATNANVSNLQANKANITDLNATNAEVENLKANKADVEYLDANYATINLLNTNVANINKALIDKANVSDLTATNAVVEDLKAGKADIADLTAVSAKVTDLQANKADISVLEANYATIKQLDATNANVGTLQAETANINKALIDKANVSDLNATNANVTNLQATKANVTDLNATNANINKLTGNLAEITTLVNGNLTSDNIQSMVITGDKFTVENGFIKNAMIDSINANKINTGTINTNNVKIQSNDGSMILQGNLQQFKDKNGKVRIQLGKDAKGNFTFVLYDENGTGQLINEKGIQSSNAIADGLIVDSKVANNANIAGSKLDIDSVVTEINDGSTSIKGTKIYLDEQKQALNVAFNNMSTTVKGNTNTIQSHTTSINTMNGKVTKLISDTTITKQDGTTTSLKDAYNATVDTVDSHSTKIGSLETNLATANSNISSVSSKQSALEQNLNGFKQTVSETYTTKADFNDLSIGGTNLQRYSKPYLIKEKPIYNIWNYSRGTVKVDYDTPFGETAFWLTYEKGKDTTNSGNSWANLHDSYKKINVTQGKVYTISLDILRGSNCKGFRIALWNCTSSPEKFLVNLFYKGTDLKDNALTHLSKQWTSTITGSVYICFYNLGEITSGSSTSNLLFSNIKFEEGNKETTWNPNPLDINDNINTVDGKFANYSTTSQMNSAITQKANEITSTVSETYATKTALNTVDGKFANYSTTSAMNSAIAQKSNEILSTVSSTYTTKTDFNDLTIGGTNLLINSDWHKGRQSPWLINTAATIDTTNGRITLPFKSGGEVEVYQIVNIDKPNTKHTFSVYIYENNLEKGLRLYWRNYNSSTDEWGSWSYVVIPLNFTGWYAYTFTPTGSRFIVDVEAYYDTGGKAVLGCFKLEQGNKATAWSPNPKDIDTAISTVDGKFVNYSTTTQMDSAINQKANEITSTVSETYATKSALKTTDDKFANYSTTSAMNSAIAQKSNEILSTVSSTYATKTALNSVDGKFANYSTTSAMNSAIEQKGNGILSTVSETYATKTALNNVDGKFANYSTTSEMNSAIDQKGDSILSTVSNTYTTKTDFNGLSVGGTNLQRFSSSYLLKDKSITNYWTAGRGNLTHASDGSMGGDCYWLAVSSGKTDCYTQLFSAYGHFDIKQGEKYSYSIDYSIGTNCAGIRFRIYNNGDTKSSLLFEDTKNVAGQTNKIHKEGTWTATWTGKAYVCIYNLGFINTANGASNLLFNNIKIEKGTFPTSWSPAPQDINANIDFVSDNLSANYSTTQQMNTAINQKAESITQSVSSTYATKTSLKSANDNITSLTNRMQSAESKLTKDSLTTTIGNYYTTSTDVNGLITNKGYATTSQVSQTADDLTVKFTSAGGYNMVRNGGFITGTNNWFDLGGGMHRGATANTRTGWYVDTSLINGMGGEWFKIYNGKYYTFSARVWTTQDLTMKYYVPLNWTTNGTGSGGYESGYISEFTFSHTTIPKDQWVDIWLTFKCIKNGYFRPYIKSEAGGADMTISVADVMITEGKVVLPWSPHPYEVYDGITQIDKYGIKVYHNSIDGNSYTHMSPSGFYLKNKGTDIFKVDSNGLYFKGNGEFTGTISASNINGSTINGTSINSDSFVGDMLAIDGVISAKALQVQDIDNAKYPATLDGNLEIYVNSSTGNDDNEPNDDVRYKTLQGAIDAIPKFLNGKTVYITMETNTTEDVYLRGFVGGVIRIYMNGKTLYGTLRSYVCSCSISVYGGTRTSTEGATGVIHPNVGLSFGSRAVSVGFEASQYAALYKVKVYAPDKIPSDVSSTDKVCVAAQAGTGSVYCKNVQIVNAVIGFRSNNHGSMHVNSSSGVASKYGFQGATGGIISIANNNQCGGKTSSTNKNGGGQVWYDANGPTFATGNQTTDSGSAPVVSTTKTMTIKSTYGDTYRSSVYNNWKKDGTVRQGDYGYGDCTGCWFFGSAFSELKGCTISKVEITITRNSGGSSSGVGLVVRTHNYSARPSGAPTLSSNSYGTLSLATGKTDKLTITHSDVLNGIKNGTIKGFAIRTTYDSAHYAVCSGSVTVKITYTE